MKNLLKIVFILIFVLCIDGLKAQEIVKKFQPSSFTNEDYSNFKSTFGNQKTILADYEQQTLIALSYFPELKNIKIKFRLKNRETPLTSRPTFFSLFRSPKKRTYVITISKKSSKQLDTITFKNLRFNAQIGVLGHELCHISDYIKTGFGGMFKIGFHQLFNSKSIDSFEYNTDLNCINHGLGYQLLDWSCNVRENLNRTNWLSASNLSNDISSERYMNPSTILEIISKHELYPKNEINIENCQDLSKD